MVSKQFHGVHISNILWSKEAESYTYSRSHIALVTCYFSTNYLSFLFHLIWYQFIYRSTYITYYESYLHISVFPTNEDFFSIELYVLFFKSRRESFFNSIHEITNLHRNPQTRRYGTKNWINKKDSIACFQKVDQIEGKQENSSVKGLNTISDLTIRRIPVTDARRTRVRRAHGRSTGICTRSR